MPTVIPARDGYELAADVSIAGDTWVIISAATAVKRSFYQPFATFLTGRGYSTVTYDYRGIGDSAPESLRGFDATVRDWALLDMAGVVDWVVAQQQPQRIILIGHSVGGQVAGLLDNSHHVDGMVTVAAQSGHWRMQGEGQRLPVAFHTYVTLPVLSRMFGYAPWSRISSAEDLPKGVALEWSRWCRDRLYLLGDSTLPLDRFQNFVAPVLAYAMTDDTWGTPRSVDAMMSAYPNLERRDRNPDDIGMAKVGHFGAFRPEGVALWQEIGDWIDQRTAG